MNLKKTSIYLLAVISCLFITQSKAQVAVPNGVTINPEFIERGKGLAKGLAKKHGKKVAIEGAKKAAPLVGGSLILKPKKTIATGAVLVAGAGVGMIWYSTTIPAAVKRLANEPDDFENYWEHLSDNFDKKLEFAETTWDLYYENIGEEQKKYENLLELLGYEIKDNKELITPVTINPKTKEEQDNLEKTNEFTLAMAEVMNLATQMDRQYKPLCKGSKGKETREKLVNLTPIDFDKMNLIKNNTETVEFLNVDSYVNLEALQNKLENDHIPSYAALEKFFKASSFNKKGKKVRVKNLEKNASAISLPYKMHRHNRTTGKVNINLSSIDQYNLRLATLLDFATLLTMKKIDIGIWETNKIDYNELLKSFSYMYGRNAQLCLYY